LIELPKFVVALFTPTCWHGYIGSTLDRVGFLVTVYTLPLVWRLDYTWFTWTLVLGVVPAMSGHFTSFTRFDAMVFPVFVSLAALFSGNLTKMRLFGGLLLAAFVGLQLVLLYRFVHFQWAG
jgi:hypothetical protein